MALSKVTYAEAVIGDSPRCDDVCTGLLFTIIFTIFPYCPKYEWDLRVYQKNRTHTQHDRQLGTAEKKGRNWAKNLLRGNLQGDPNDIDQGLLENPEAGELLLVSLNFPPFLLRFLLHRLFLGSLLLL